MRLNAIVKRVKMGKMSDLEFIVSSRITLAKVPKPEREYVFHPGRRWRFDFAWPDYKIALECEGGIFSMGRHTRGKGFIGDCEKYNQAMLDGWIVLRYTTHTIDRVVDDLKYIFGKKTAITEMPQKRTETAFLDIQAESPAFLKKVQPG